MKKLLGIGITALMLVALLALPTFACWRCMDLDVEDNNMATGGSSIWEDVDYDYDYDYMDNYDHDGYDNDGHDERVWINFNAGYCGIGNDLAFRGGHSSGGQSLMNLVLYEKYYSRFDKLSGSVFTDSEGIITVQQSAGNTNAQLSNVGLDVKYMGDIDLAGVGQTIGCVVITEKDYMRFDEISGSAFAGAAGILTVQQSSGNANLQQSNVDVEISPKIFCCPGGTF